MFDNIGDKIKGLASFITIVVILFSIIYGIVFIAGEGSVIGGLFVIVIGSIISWVSSFLLYGFGQLISNTDYIAKNLRKLETQKVEQTVQRFTEVNAEKDTQSRESVKVYVNNQKIKCPSCGLEQEDNPNRTVCWNCRQPFIRE